MQEQQWQRLALTIYPAMVWTGKLLSIALGIITYSSSMVPANLQRTNFMLGWVNDCMLSAMHVSIWGVHELHRTLWYAFS